MVAVIQRVGHSYDSPQWSVAQMMKRPTLVPGMVVQGVKDNLIADLLLRQGPSAPGGAVQYQEQVTFSSARDAEIIAEFGEIPTTQSDIAMPVVAATQKRGLGLKVSKEMETRNDVGRVAQEVALARDAMIRSWNRVFFLAVYRSSVLTMNASRQATGGWTVDVVPSAGLTPTAGIRKDIANAQYLMANQTIQGQPNFDQTRYGFVPDTMVVHPSLMPILLDSEEVNKVFMNSDSTDISPRFTMRYPTKFGILDIVQSWEILPNHCLVLKRNTLGFVSDEWPLAGSPMLYTEREQTYNTYFTRRALNAIDTPRSAVLINGIQGTITAVP
jgi:hypothetical protein